MKNQPLQHIIVFSAALTLGFSLCLLSCTKADLPLNQPPKGTWVELNSRSDTIRFQRIDDLEFFTLTLGIEGANGIGLPKYGSGMYLYTLGADYISMRWLLSSYSEFKTFYFRRSGNRIHIGNFYDAPYGEILKFEKLN